MSKTSNPTLIGSFVLAALALAAACALYFGSVSFSSGNPIVIVFFDESVSGLLEGAKVKLRGVPIGTVKKIALQVEGQPELGARIPVLLELDLAAMQRLGSTSSDLSRREFTQRIAAAVDQGLRARLQLESLITGLFFVELDFIKPAPPPVYTLEPEEAPYPELPAVPSPFAAINQGAGEIMTRIALIPFDELSRQLLTLLTQVEQLLSAAQRDDLLGDISATLKSVRQQLADVEVGDSVASLQRTLAAVERLVARLDEGVSPLLVEADGLAALGKEALVDARGTIASLQATSDDVRRLLAPESSFRYNLEAALNELASAAAAVERLADQLERNPRAWISGKARNEP